MFVVNTSIYMYHCFLENIRDNQAQLTFSMEPFVRKLKSLDFYKSWIWGSPGREPISVPGGVVGKLSNIPTLQDLHTIDV